MALGQFVDLVRRERGEKALGELAQERVPQTVDALEMFEEQDQPLEMRRFQLAVDAIEGMRDGVGDVSGLEITLEGQDVVANDDNVGMLGLADSPDQDVNLAGILRKICRNLLADECIG
jgi:hypothetical protein